MGDGSGEERVEVMAGEDKRTLPWDVGRVVAMRADWTRPNPAIDAYLARFGRAGIPFNVVYGPAAPGGLPLPELLTTGAVTGALAQAAGR